MLYSENLMHLITNFESFCNFSIMIDCSIEVTAFSILKNMSKSEINFNVTGCRNSIGLHLPNYSNIYIVLK